MRRSYTMFWLTACMFGGGKPQPGITGVEPSIEPEDPSDSGVDTERSEVDLCDAIYLLELSSSYSSEYIWRYDINTHHHELVGQMACPKAYPGDFLVALSADSKGLLWAISNQSDVYAIRNDTLDCSYTQINASSEQPPFIGRSLAFMRQDPESDDELFFSGLNQ